jgi:hypothetical protein
MVKSYYYPIILAQKSMKPGPPDALRALILGRHGGGGEALLDLAIEMLRDLH